MVDFLLFLLELLANILLLIFFFRISSKKELQEVSVVDIAYLVILANIAWDLTLEEQYHIHHSALAMSLVTGLIWLINWLTYRNQKLDKLIVGEPKTLIKDGKLNKELMRKEMLSENELEAMLRAKGYFELDEVELGILEVSGELSVKPKQ